MRERIATKIAGFIFTVVIPSVVLAMIPVDPAIGWRIVGVSILVGLGLWLYGLRPHSPDSLQPISERFGSGLLFLSALSALFLFTQWAMTPLVAEKLPGFSWFAVLNMHGTPLNRRQYVFEFGTPEGPRSAFYLSASQRFVFEMSDIHGSAYQLDIPLGHNGIPIGEWTALICEIAVGSNYAYFRAVVNGKTVQRRDLPFPIELGSLRWTGHIGSDLSGRNNGGFDFAEMGTVAPVTLNDGEVEALTKNIKSHYGF